MRSFGAARVAVTPRLREWETEGLHASLVGSAVLAAATGESRPVACSGRDALRDRVRRGGQRAGHIGLNGAQAQVAESWAGSRRVRCPSSERVALKQRLCWRAAVERDECRSEQVAVRGRLCVRAAKGHASALSSGFGGCSGCRRPWHGAKMSERELSVRGRGRCAFAPSESRSRGGAVRVAPCESRTGGRRGRRRPGGEPRLSPQTNLIGQGSAGPVRSASSPHSSTGFGGRTPAGGPPRVVCWRVSGWLSRRLGVAFLEARRSACLSRQPSQLFSRKAN